MRFAIGVFIVFSLLMGSLPHHGQAAPSRLGGLTMTLLTTEPEDSQTTAFYRLIPQFLEKFSPNSLLLDYMPGLGGAKAWHTLQRRRADGSQLAAVTFPPFLLKPMAGETYFTPDLTAPVCILASAPLGIWVSDTSPARNIASLLEQIRADRTHAYIAGVGSLTAHHMATLYFNQAAGVTTEYLPYIGSRESSHAVQNKLAVAAWGSATHHTLMPGMRLIAVASAQRSPIYPNVPTLNESGIFVEISEQYGVALPAKSPDETKKTASDLFVSIVTDSTFVEKAYALGFSITPARYEELPDLLARQRQALKAFAEHFLLTGL